MRGLGEGIAFAALCLAAAALEIFDKDTSGLWVIIVLWAIFSDWGQKDEKKSDQPKS